MGRSDSGCLYYLRMLHIYLLQSCIIASCEAGVMQSIDWLNRGLASPFMCSEVIRVLLKQFSGLWVSGKLFVFAVEWKRWRNFLFLGYKQVNKSRFVMISLFGTAPFCLTFDDGDSMVGSEVQKTSSLAYLPMDLPRSIVCWQICRAFYIVVIFSFSLFFFQILCRPRSYFYFALLYLL